MKAIVTVMLFFCIGMYAFSQTATDDEFSGPLSEYFFYDSELNSAIRAYIQRQHSAGNIIEADVFPEWFNHPHLQWVELIPIEDDARAMVERMKQYIARDGFQAIDMMWFYLGISDDGDYLIAVDSGR